MAAQVLAARERAQVGRSTAREARRTGYVPAVMYGKGVDTVALEVEERELSRILRADGKQATIALDIAGKSQPTLCRVQDVQRVPVSREIRHIDFVVVPEGSDG